MDHLLIGPSVTSLLISFTFVLNSKALPHKLFRSLLYVDVKMVKTPIILTITSLPKSKNTNKDAKQSDEQ